MAWKMIHAADKGLFPQAVLIPLLHDHGVLALVAGQQLDVIKLLPTLVIDEGDVDHLLGALRETIAACHRFPGPVWQITKRLSGVTAQGMTACPCAQTLVQVGNRNPLATFEANIQGTWTLLEACRTAAAPVQVVMASSDKAYGHQPVLPYTEETPLQGRHPYDVSKSCADLIALSYAAPSSSPASGWEQVFRQG
jgi:hypothetical protein